MMQTLLGKSVFKGDPEPYWVIRREQVTGIFAPTMYGKSVLFNHLVLGEAKFKNYIFIIDYMGEHEDLKYPNCFSDKPDCIPDLTIIKNPGFLIEDFNKTIYWSSMGFPPSGSQMLADMAKKVKEHNNDPNLFLKMIENMDENISWQKSRKESIREKFKPEIFISPDDDNRTYIPNYGELLKRNKKVLLNLGLERGNIDLARTFAGVIFDQLEEFIIKEKITPISIFMEESDVLLPDEEYPPYCCSVIERLSLKHQRHGVSLYLLSQHVNKINQNIRKNIRTFILGKLTKNDLFGDIVQSLVWDIDKNYREFMILKKDGSRLKFVPFDSPILYRRRN